MPDLPQRPVKSATTQDKMMATPEGRDALWEAEMARRKALLSLNPDDPKQDPMAHRVGQAVTSIPGGMARYLLELPKRAIGAAGAISEPVTSDMQDPWGTAANVAGEVSTALIGGGAVRQFGKGAANTLGTSGGKPGITAYHGSPHDFDKFDMSKIGTGEGAQAYGHGLYFAENENVGLQYKKSLGGSRVEINTPEGTRAKFDYDEWHDNLPAILTKNVPGINTQAATSKIKIAVADAAQSGKQPLEAFDEFTNGLIAKMEANKVSPHIIEFERRSNAQIRAALEQIDPKTVNVGRMYETRINASPDEFLDWDKPLSEQPKKVQEVLRDIGAAQKNRPLSETDLGRELYFKQSQGLTNTSASERLREAGIKGIKYSDQGSRGKEGGTSNFVVFDDSIIEILRKYGIAGLIGGGAAANLSVDDATAAVKKPRTRTVLENMLR